MPTVSVIVPNYNHARFLLKRIESVLRQTYADFELIILDDCSTDDSRSILSQYAGDPRVRLEFNEVNSGSAFKQWNKGVRLAQGKYIWIAESDDYADERLLGRLAGILDADSKIAFAYCRSRRVDGDDRPKELVDTHTMYSDASLWDKDFCLTDLEARRDHFRYTNPVNNASAAVFRKEVYERVGGADESFRICGDWKCWADMALCGSVAYVSEPLNYYRFHEGSIRSKGENDAQGIVETLRVVRLLMGQGTVVDASRERFCEIACHVWVWALMNRRVPLRQKWIIFRSIRAVDPHAMRRAVGPALTVIRLKIARVWRGLRPNAAERYANR